MFELSFAHTLVRCRVEGTPTLPVLRGEVIPSHMRREGIDEESLLAALREHGVSMIRDVEMAVLEIDGSIRVIPAGSPIVKFRKDVKV